MPEPATIAEAIEQNAQGPSAMAVGNESLTQKNIAELIEADRYLKGLKAAKKKNCGIRFSKFVPQGGG